MRTAILLFVKFPESGKVKTRLAAGVGAEKAAAIYRQLVEAVLSRLPGGEPLVVMFDPPHRASEIARWIGPLCAGRAVEFIAQTAGDLGARLTAAFAHAFGRGFDRVAAIGSDCPELTAADFAETWRALDTCDCVLGPASDGGYYLVALKQPEPSLFSGIAWSTSAVFKETIARLHARNLSAHRLRQLADVDTEEDWQRAASHLSGTADLSGSFETADETDVADGKKTRTDPAENRICGGSIREIRVIRG